jgi:[CysO sulfur-carrier protein]-S-L-cysteine hydrolase
MDEIRLARDVAARILNHAQKEPAIECCGLLAGESGVITHVFPAENAAELRSVSYEIAPKELFRLMREIRASGLELLGIYHSNGDNRPSPRDVERAYYPDVAYFIISPHADEPQPVRAYSIREGRWAELEIEIQV